MEEKVEGTHTSFLIYITGMKDRRIVGRTWETHGAEVVWDAAGTQSSMTYIWRRQENVAHWVVLQPIFKVCAGVEGIRRGWMQEGGLVLPSSDRETTSIHLGRSLMGG